MQSATCLLIVALVMPLSTLAEPWDSDYGAALRAAKRDGKAVLVVIAEGDNGWRFLAREGWSPRSLQLAREHFHCVYVNASDGGYGTALARAFAVRNLPALVISDRWGQTQALRREGTLTDQELQQLLTLHAASGSGPVRGSAPTDGVNRTVGLSSSNSTRPAASPTILCPT